VGVVVAVVFRTSQWGGGGAVFFSFLFFLKRILLERNYVSSSLHVWNELICHCSCLCCGLVVRIRFCSRCGHMFVDIGSGWFWRLIVLTVRICGRSLKNILGSSSEFLLFSCCYKLTQDLLD